MSGKKKSELKPATAHPSLVFRDVSKGWIASVVVPVLAIVLGAPAFSLWKTIRRYKTAGDDRRLPQRKTPLAAGAVCNALIVDCAKAPIAATPFRIRSYRELNTILVEGLPGVSDIKSTLTKLAALVVCVRTSEVSIRHEVVRSPRRARDWVSGGGVRRLLRTDPGLGFSGRAADGSHHDRDCKPWNEAAQDRLVHLPCSKHGTRPSASTTVATQARHAPSHGQAGSIRCCVRRGQSVCTLLTYPSLPAARLTRRSVA